MQNAPEQGWQCCLLLHWRCQSSSSSSPFSSNFVSGVFINVASWTGLVLVTRAVGRSAAIRPDPCRAPWSPLFWVSGCQWLGRAPGPRKAGLLGRDVFYKYALHRSNCPLPWQPSDLPGCPLPCFLAFPPSFSIPRLSLSLLGELKAELEAEVVWLYRGDLVLLFTFPCFLC